MVHKLYLNKAVIQKTEVWDKSKEGYIPLLKLMV